jgi:sugar/nucleoside kinase (ribokinase family)
MSPCGVLRRPSRKSITMKTTFSPHLPPTDIVALGALQLDVLANPGERTNGAKHPARITLRVGGSAANIARAARYQNVSTSVVSMQTPLLAKFCRGKLVTLGVRPLINERSEDHDGAITVGLPRAAGDFDLYVQAMKLCLSDLTAAARAALTAARLVIVGPMAQPDQETLALLGDIASSVPAALLPHPDFIRQPEFGAVARGFDYVQVNAAEAALLEPDHRASLPILALKLRFVLGGYTEFAITNGSLPGLLWAHGASGWNWIAIEAKPAHVVSDVGAGDCWATSYLVGRRLLGLEPVAACRRACEVAAEWVGGKPHQADRTSRHHLRPGLRSRTKVRVTSGV